MEKKCTKCKRSLPLDRFGRDTRPSSKSKIRSRCKDCYAEEMRELRKRKNEHFRLYDKSRYSVPKIRAKKIAAARAAYDPTKPHKSNPRPYSRCKDCYAEEMREGIIEL
jgi:hypothetical protein